MKIGFAGLGQMGRPMAMNLAKAGAELTVCARRPDGFDAFTARGVAASTDFAAVAGADLLFLCLPDGAVVKSVLLGPGGVLDRPKAGQIVVDLSTSAYMTTREIGARLAEAGIGFCDAPVSGMEARAVDATLTIMCGAEPAVFEAVRPWLEKLGNKILLMGSLGSGQLTKLINQLLFDINAAALAEVLPMAVKLGLDPDQVGEVINSGTGRSHASEFFIPRMLKGDFSAGYPMKNAYKDLVSGLEISGQMGIPLPVLTSATATYQTALCQGHGDLDKGGMVRVFEALLGVLYRSRNPGQA